jgi:hypothetical protein
MTLLDFYTYAPIEIDYVLKAYFEKVENENIGEWERVRTQIYYSYLFVPTKRRKVTYETFKRDYLKFSFDDKDKKNEEVIDDEQFAMIQKIMKEKTGT